MQRLACFVLHRQIRIGEEGLGGAAAHIDHIWLDGLHNPLDLQNALKWSPPWLVSSVRSDQPNENERRERTTATMAGRSTIGGADRLKGPCKMSNQSQCQASGWTWIGERSTIIDS